MEWVYNNAVLGIPENIIIYNVFLKFIPALKRHSLDFLAKKLS